MATATTVKKNAAAAKGATAAKKATATAKPARAPRKRKAAAVEVVTEVMPVVEAAGADANVMDAMPAVEASPRAEAVEMAGQSEPSSAMAGDEAQTGVVRKGRSTRYVLPTNMEIAALGPVHEQLVTLEASNDGPFVLDGANLSVIDTAGLQLLISFVTAVQASGKKVSWDNYSVQAYQLANELGVVEQLGD
ncbi:MAG TPA: STAS domain-containing protein [Pseudomonadales bacterium]